MYGGFHSLAALSRSGTLRPFDARHDGILIGEAAAVIAVEPLDDARSRGADPLGAVASQRLVSDGIHMTSPDIEGKAMARAIRRALDDAGLSASDIGCITVTAAGSAVYDRMQSAAVELALGREAASNIPVTTWENATGHALAATGVLGIIHALLVLRSGRVTALSAIEDPDPGCAALRPATGEPRPLRSPCVLALTVGFGGQNGASVITSADLAADLAGDGGRA
jgi:3-oxoacyl-[acyl-carrier-protein] synthase II